jgi:hypothetical protein
VADRIASNGSIPRRDVAFAIEADAVVWAAQPVSKLRREGRDLAEARGSGLRGHLRFAAGYQSVRRFVSKLHPCQLPEARAVRRRAPPDRPLALPGGQSGSQGEGHFPRTASRHPSPAKR